MAAIRNPRSRPPPASGSASSAPVPPASPRPTTSAPTATRSRSSRRRKRPGACCAMASRRIACRRNCSSRSSTRSGSWASRSTPAPRSAAWRHSERTMTPSSSDWAPRWPACSPSKACTSRSCWVASTSCVRCAAAKRCASGRASWSSGAATWRSTWRSPRCARAGSRSTWCVWRSGATCRPARTRSRKLSPKACRCGRAGARCASRRRARSSSSSARA